VRSSDFSGHLSRFINENLCVPKWALRRAGRHANTKLFHLRPELAERVGIEPTVPLPGQQFSRLPDSATLAPLRRPKDRAYSHTYCSLCKMDHLAGNGGVVIPVVEFLGDPLDRFGAMKG
jgi:hypothetical protein